MVYVDAMLNLMHAEVKYERNKDRMAVVHELFPPMGSFTIGTVFLEMSAPRRSVALATLLDSAGTICVNQALQFILHMG